MTRQENLQPWVWDDEVKLELRRCHVDHPVHSRYNKVETA